MAKHFYEAIATLTGFVIGAGVLGIPFVIAKAGFITGLIDIIIIGILVLYLNLITGEIALRTKGSHQLTGYAEKYLGKKAKLFIAFSIIFSLYGALTAYIIKEGQFIHNILNPFFGGDVIIYSLVFFVIFATIVFIGIKAIGKSELLMVGFFLLIVIVILIFALPNISMDKLSTFSAQALFIPYGVLLFAFHGMEAIPEMREELKKNEKKLKKAIIFGSIIPIFIYIIFTLVVIGSSKVITDGAILGLSEVLGPKIFTIGVLFGILVMATSFIAVALAIKEMFMFDFKLNKNLSSILSCFFPLAISIVLLSSNIQNSFFRVIDFVGAIGVSITGILLVFIYKKAKTQGDRKPEYTLKSKWFYYVIALVFIAGLAHKIAELLGFI